MEGMEEFRVLFGGVTLWQVVELGLALGFALALYKKVKNYILERHDAEQTRDEQLAKALDSINRYPEYRAQSLKIQDELRDRLLEAHRYYTGKGAWNAMEATVFWELFHDYEKLGGDGFVHGTIEPAMRALPVLPISTLEDAD